MKNKVLKTISRFFFEFIIVTLGILAAFSINKWDENRKLEEERIASYTSLQQDMEAELYVYNFYKEPLIKAKSYLSPILAQDFSNVDSLMLYLNTSFDLQERNAGYINLKFSGKLELLENEEIKKGVTLYYETYYQALENMSKWNYDFRLHFLQPYFIQELEYNADKTSILEQLEKDEFMNLIQSQYQLIEYNIGTIDKSEKLVQNILELLNKELQ